MPEPSLNRKPDSPVYDRKNAREIHPIITWLSRFGLKLFGWEIVGETSDIPKYVLIAAPHTSKWDWVLMIAGSFALKTSISWIGKKELLVFKWPLAWISRLTNGIPIDRGKSHNYVQQVVQKILKTDHLVLVIPPEGTRKRTEYWRTGFYYIALGAQVPIVFGVLDYGRKRAGQGRVFMPSGDIHADMETIREYYKDFTAKFPENFGPVRVKE